MCLPGRGSDRFPLDNPKVGEDRYYVIPRCRATIRGAGRSCSRRASWSCCRWAGWRCSRGGAARGDVTTSWLSVSWCAGHIASWWLGLLNSQRCRLAAIYGLGIIYRLLAHLLQQIKKSKQFLVFYRIFSTN